MDIGPVDHHLASADISDQLVKAVFRGDRHNNVLMLETASLKLFSHYRILLRLPGPVPSLFLHLISYQMVPFTHSLPSSQERGHIPNHIVQVEFPAMQLLQNPD